MRRLIVVIAALAMPLVASAQYSVGGYTGDNVVMSFVETPRDVAALGLGGTNALGSDAASNAFGNPAATPFMEGTSSVALSYGMNYRGLVTATNSVSVGFAYNFASKLGIDFGIAMDPSKYGATGSDENGSRLDEVSQPSALMVSAGLSYRPLDFLSFGANVKYFDQGLFGSSLSAFASDIFAMGRFAGLSATLGIRNLGTVFNTGYDLPTVGVLSLGYAAELGKHGLSATVEGDGYLYGAYAVCGGLSYSYNKMVTARFGGHYGPDSPLGNYLSAGLGFAISVVGIDCAYVFSNGPFADSFRVGLKFKF